MDQEEHRVTIGELVEREVEAANYHMGAKEALFDRHGYGAPRRWTASFAWNLYESLHALGAFPVSYRLEPFIDEAIKSAERHGLVLVRQASGAACWFHQDFNEIGFDFTYGGDPCRVTFDGQLAAMLFHGDAAIAEVIDAEMRNLAKEGERRRLLREIRG